MWKIPVFLLLVIAMGVAGIILGADLKLRRKDLEQFQYGIRVIEREMNYETSSLCRCFEQAANAAEGEVSKVFADIVDGLKKNGHGEWSFSESLRRHRNDLAFTDEDMVQIGRFGRGLGESDLEHALKDLAHLDAIMTQQLCDAERNEQKWGRLLRNGGWLTGLCAALIFI